jgi:hypothetical protein
MKIIYSKQKYQPIVLCIAGYIMEYMSKKQGKNMSCTWDYYGFETIIWAKKE